MQEYSEQKEITKKVVEFFQSEQFDEIYAFFDDKMKAALPTEKLKEIWCALPDQCGKYIDNGQTIVSEAQGYIVLNHLLDFEHVDLDLRLAFNSKNQISGLFFVPPVKKKE